MVSRMMVAASLLVMCQWAQAGEVLRLQAGDVRPNDVQSMDRFMAAADRQHLANTQLHIVQFKQVIRAEDQQMLKAAGVTVRHYIPDDAYIIEGSVDAIRELSQQAAVQAVVPMMPQWKKSPDLPKASVFTQHHQVVVHVHLGADEQGLAFRSALRGVQGVEILAGEGNAYYVRLGMTQIDDLTKMDEVIWIQPFQEMKLQNMELPEAMAATRGDASPMSGNYKDLNGFESGTRIMGFEEAWARGFTGKGQIVSMADTGLDSGNKSTIFRDFANIPKGYSFGLGAQDWADKMGHGTHVAGSVMGGGVASGGIVRGGAYEAEMIPQGMWSPIIDNLTVPPKLKSLFEPAFADGARVHTNSWGGGQLPGAYDSFASQVDTFIWENPDMLILFAAGNNGVDGNKDGRIDDNSMASPGSAKNVLTVGASENLVLNGGIQRKLGDLMGGQPWGIEPLKSDTLSNNADGMAAFSSRGPCRDGRIKPDIVAPGTNVLSNCSHVQNASPLWGNYNADYCWSGGTSMSTPLVAGAAAVLRQYLAQEWNNSAPSGALMKALLMNTADDMFPGQYGTGRGQELPDRAPNSIEGYGRVNIDRATTPRPLKYYYEMYDHKQGIGTSENFTERLTVPEGPLRVTLVYSDAPGAPNAARALVNNLDLEVTSADGTTKSLSSVDNVEQVVLGKVPAGEVTIKVVGKNVPQGRNGKQPFAVVVTR